jgi:hypothetical protein
MNPADEMAAKIGPSERQLDGAGAGSDEKSDQQLRTILENLQRLSPLQQDDLYSGIADSETSERRAIYSRLVAIEKEIKRQRSSNSSLRHPPFAALGEGQKSESARQ